MLMCLQSQSVSDIVESAGVFGQGALIWLAVPDGGFTSDPYLPGKVAFYIFWKNFCEMMIFVSI